jgi:hypothetical protein
MPEELFWYRVRKIFNRWHVIVSTGDNRDFPTLQTAAIFAATFAMIGYVNADQPRRNDSEYSSGWNGADK